MFLNIMFRKLCRYLFRFRYYPSRRRITYQFTDEQFATVAQTCPVSFNRPIENGPFDEDIGTPPCQALLYCQNCGKLDEHLTEDCKIKSCDSEYYKMRYPHMQPPKESPFERMQRIGYMY